MTLWRQSEPMGGRLGLFERLRPAGVSGLELGLKSYRGVSQRSLLASPKNRKHSEM